MASFLFKARLVIPTLLMTSRSSSKMGGKTRSSVSSSIPLRAIGGFVAASSTLVGAGMGGVVSRVPVYFLCRCLVFVLFCYVFHFLESNYDPLLYGIHAY